MNPSSGNGTKPTLLIALGGNALIRKGHKGTIIEQFENLRVPIRQIASLTSDYRIIITHGNGPQVGKAYAEGDVDHGALYVGHCPSV